MTSLAEPVYPLRGMPWHARIALIGGIVGASALALVHLLMAGIVDPARHPVSRYALIPPGDILFPAGVLGLAIACLALAWGGLSLPRQTGVRALLVVASFALVLAAIYRTDYTGSVSSLSGHIHRYSAGLAFVTLTVAAYLVSTRIGGWAMVLTILSAAALLITTLGIMMPGVSDTSLLRGLPQRFYLAAQIALIIAAAFLPQRDSGSLPKSGRFTAGPGPARADMSSAVMLSGSTAVTGLYRERPRP